MSLLASSNQLFLRNYKAGIKQLHYRYASTGTLSKIGFIGLGNMGANMATNLVKKGENLVVYDVQSAASAKFEKLKVEIATSPAEVAKKCSHIITMLPASQHVKSSFTGSDGILAGLQPGAVVIDSSTIDPEVSKEIAALVKEKKGTFLDAPVSGGVGAAAGGTLTFMVGGPESDFASISPILSKMGSKVVYCGGVGAGGAAKICNNMLLAISMIGTAETMNLGIRLGLDPKLLANILNSSSGRCWSSEIYNPVPNVLPNSPASNNYAGGFGTALMTKDLGLAQGAAMSTSTPTPLGSLSHSIYRLMCSQGLSSKDFSSVYLFLQESLSTKTNNNEN